MSVFEHRGDPRSLSMVRSRQAQIAAMREATRSFARQNRNNIKMAMREQITREELTEEAIAAVKSNVGEVELDIELLHFIETELWNDINSYSAEEYQKYQDDEIAYFESLSS